MQGTTFAYAACVAVYYNGQALKVKPPLYAQLVAVAVTGHHPTV
jgi:hypothetical protein